MKLLYLTPGCFDKGGISRYSRYQITAWRELLGEENVRVLSMLGPDAHGFESPFSVTWSAGGTGLSEKAAFVLRATREALVWRPDAIHVAHVHLSGYSNAIGKLTGASSILNTYGIEVWSGLRGDASWGLKKTEHVISDCHFTARFLERSNFRRAGTTEVIWDCVDLDRFVPGVPRREVLERYGIPDPSTGMNLLSLGRMTSDCAYKGYERLLDAFSFVAPRCPDLRLVFAGRGGLNESLRATAEARGLGDRVHTLGMVHEADMVDVYQSAHLFSLVSDWGVDRGEGLPLTPLEAAACGVPIVVGNQDGSAEAAVNGVSGYVLDPFDLEQHGSVIESLFRDKDRRERIGKEARLRMEKEFGYPMFRERHRRLWNKWFDGRRTERERE